MTTAVLVKGDLTGTISLVRLGEGFILLSQDSRRAMPHIEYQYDSEAAERSFRAAVLKSRRRGWHLIYKGPVLRDDQITHSA